MHKAYENCTLCPRRCGVNRQAGERGACGQTGNLRVARAALHYWEEPCISGGDPDNCAGSGAVFFSGCGLGCVFCQNREISSDGFGKAITVERLSGIFLELQEKGACNINLVTGTHFVPHIAAALEDAVSRGLNIPVVYNSSGYEAPDTVRALEGLADIWLPDMKFRDSALSLRYCRASDYFEKAAAAIETMVRLSGPPVFDGEGLIKRGVIVRHLVLPGQTADSKRILRYLHDTYGSDIMISIMSQYTPMKDVPAELQRTVSDEEYGRVVDFARRIGIEDGYIQEGGCAVCSFIPAFDLSGV